MPGFPGFPGFSGPPYQVPLSSQVTDRPRGLHSASKNPRLLQAQGSGVALHPRHAEPIFLFSSSLLGPPALGTLTTRHDTMSQTLSERCCVPAPPEGHTSPPPPGASPRSTRPHTPAASVSAFVGTLVLREEQQKCSPSPIWTVILSSDVPGVSRARDMRAGRGLKNLNHSHSEHKMVDHPRSSSCSFSGHS